MDRRPDDLVSDQWRSLVTTAQLLTGDAADAAALAARGFGCVRGSVPPDDVDARRRAALRGLVRAHIARWARFRAPTGALTGPIADAWWISPADAEAARRLSAALDRLTPARRAAAVLAHHEGLGPADLCAVLGRSDAGALLAEAERELAAEVPDPADLPDRLDSLAARWDARTVGEESVREAVRAHRRARRHRWAIAAIVVTALVAGWVFVPSGAPGTRAAVAMGDGAHPTSSSVARPADHPDPVYGLPTRGSLAGDAAFLAALPTAALSADGGPGRLAVPTVVYAGDAGGTRWVLLVGEPGPELPTGELQAWWLTGPAGTPADRLDTWGPVDTVRGRPLGATSDVTGGPVALVVAAPGDDVRVSVGLDVLADGTSSRRYLPVRARDGVAVTPIDRPTGTGVRYRVGSAGQPAAALSTSAEEPAVPSGPGPLQPRSGSPVDADTVRAGMTQVPSVTGWSEAALEESLLASGPVPTPGGAWGEAAVLATVLPGGAVVVTADWEWTGEDRGGSGPCSSSSYPAGTDLRTLTLVVQCSGLAADGGGPASRLLLVVALPTVRSAALHPVDGAPVDVPLDNGWGSALDPDGSLIWLTVPGVLVPVRPSPDPLHG